VIKKQ